MVLCCNVYLAIRSPESKKEKKKAMFYSHVACITGACPVKRFSFEARQTRRGVSQGVVFHVKVTWLTNAPLRGRNLNCFVPVRLFMQI